MAKYEEGATHTSKDGTNWIVRSGEWVKTDVTGAEELGLREKIGSFVNENIPGVETAARKASEMLGIEPGTSPEEATRTAGEFLMNLPLPRAGALQPFGDVQSALEALPAAGGAAGAVVGAPVAGSGLGELARQGFRETAGAPPATGMLQGLFGLDPSSTEARALGLGGEMGMGGVGEILSSLVGPFTRSARRSAQNLVKLPEKILEKELKRGGTKGKEVLDRFIEEGIAPPGSTRRTQVALAEEKLSQSSAEAEALQSAMADRPLRESKVDEVLKTLEGALPPERPGGMPKLGKTQIENAQKALDDAVGFISESDGVTLSKARGEKQRISEEISALFESGADTPLSKKALERAGRAWQKAINESFPELGEAELRRSDLITINKYIKKALSKAEFAGADLSAEGVSAGAAAAGRYSIPAMVLGKAAAIATAGPISSMSGSGKRLVAKILSSPANTQTWLRLMAQLGRSEEEE